MFSKNMIMTWCLHSAIPTPLMQFHSPVMWSIKSLSSFLVCARLSKAPNRCSMVFPNLRFCYLNSQQMPCLTLVWLLPGSWSLDWPGFMCSDLWFLPNCCISNLVHVSSCIPLTCLLWNLLDSPLTKFSHVCESNKESLLPINYYVSITIACCSLISPWKGAVFSLHVHTILMDVLKCVWYLSY